MHLKHIFYHVSIFIQLLYLNRCALLFLPATTSAATTVLEFIAEMLLLCYCVINTKCQKLFSDYGVPVRTSFRVGCRSKFRMGQNTNQSVESYKQNRVRYYRRERILCLIKKRQIIKRTLSLEHAAFMLALKKLEIIRPGLYMIICCCAECAIYFAAIITRIHTLRLMNKIFSTYIFGFRVCAKRHSC